MIGFIDTSVTSYLNCTQLQRYRYRTQFQFTVAHALGFSVFTGRFLETDLTQKLALQINMKYSCHFLFKNPGTSELN
jgi:hypothetical protein